MVARNRLHEAARRGMMCGGNHAAVPIPFSEGGPAGILRGKAGSQSTHDAGQRRVKRPVEVNEQWEEQT